MSQLDLKIGPKIKAFRRQLGLQANKLAEELSISPSYLNLIEGGKRKIDGDLLLKICEKLNISHTTRVNQLTEDQVLKIREFIDQNYKVEGDLRREVSVNIKRLVDLATYRGSRHKKKLPVRGQRTHCNARTRKGKAIAIAGKKLTPLKK